MVLGALLVKVLSSRSMFDIAELRLVAHTASDIKVNFPLMRLAHFLSTEYLAAIYSRQDSKILKWRILSPVIKTGMHSLEVYSLSIVVVVVLNIFVLAHTASLSDRLGTDALAFLVLASTAAVLAHRRALTLRN